MITLKKNERLIYAGETALRAPNGTPLPSVPQYMIVSVDEADPAHISELQGNERLILAGHIFNDKKRAEERFVALKEGREQPPPEIGIPLYIKEDATNVNPETGFTQTEEKANNALAEDLLATFAMQMRKRKALERQEKKKRSK